jgi:hypothetical protein
MLADATAAPLIALAVAACGNGGGGASASPTMRRLLAHLTAGPAAAAATAPVPR